MNMINNYTSKPSFYYEYCQLVKVIILLGRWFDVLEVMRSRRRTLLRLLSDN